MQMQVQLQVQLQIRMKLTVLRLLLKRIFLLIQITVLIMRIMRIIPIYFQGGSISGGSTFKDGSVINTRCQDFNPRACGTSAPVNGVSHHLCASIRRVDYHWALFKRASGRCRRPATAGRPVFLKLARGPILGPRGGQKWIPREISCRSHLFS